MPNKEKTLLIIDDEKDICDFEKAYFEKKGFKVFTAHTGETGINLAKSKKPDGVIIDVHLSKGISGIEALQRIRLTQAKCQCIMVTWDKEKAKEAKNLGAAGYIIKPNDIKELEKIVRKVLK